MARGSRGRFLPGESGNPSGRGKDDFELMMLCRDHSKEAVGALIEIMRNKKSADSHRIMAANSLLDRGYGRPKQSFDVQSNKPFVIFAPQTAATTDEWLVAARGMGIDVPSTDLPECITIQSPIPSSIDPAIEQLERAADELQASADVRREVMRQQQNIKLPPFPVSPRAPLNSPTPFGSSNGGRKVR